MSRAQTSKPLAKLIEDINSNLRRRKPVPSVSASAWLTPRGVRPNWEEIPDAKSVLLGELEALYWQGVPRELTEVIRTLRAWQDADHKDIEVKEESEGLEICGFDTFLDQVSESSREFAVQYARERARRMERTMRGEYVPYEATLQSLARKFYANEKSRALKEEIHAAANKSSVLTGDKIRTRARMLLQSAAWLDMDKFIEHRPPLDEVGFWKRPTPPQLTLQGFDQSLQPLFQPLRCAFCFHIIRGTWFRCIWPDCTHKGRDGSICQTCQHNEHHPNSHLVKQHKQCVLHQNETLISSSVSRLLCRCVTVARFDSDGYPRPLYPVQKSDQHRTTKKGGVLCCLLDLPRAVAEAKYQGVAVLQTDERLSLRDQRRIREEVARKQAEKKMRRDMRGMGSWERRDYEKNNAQKYGTTETFVEEEAGQDIPFFLRNIIDRYPFGNVHMAVRFGPLMVENGVKHSQGGALITSRDPPQWQLSSPGTGDDIERCLAVSSGDDRRLYQVSHMGVPRRPKRYKAALKQVVGGLFSGFSCAGLENEVIDQVVDASSNFDLDSPEDHPRDREELWDSVLAPILEKLQTLMHSRVHLMLSTLSQKLLDESIDLKWDSRSNNCQNFCDNIIDQYLYRPFLAPPATSDNPDPPQYLMSFVCRPEAYQRVRKAKTKYDVPSGLCEEYLLKFRYGLHVESDVIDSLLEYWYDWGSFGGPLYPFQDLFPWDCTEAYSRSNVVCGAGCSVSKHVWSFPFDSWSMIELHLARNKLMYQPPSTSTATSSTTSTSSANHWWTKNRLTLLLAQTALLEGAKAMANSSNFRASTAWMSVPATTGTEADNTDVRVDRYKLGGIHRAQPFSHHYDEGKYHEYFTADWAHLCRADQIAEYEAMRDLRRELADIPQGPQSDGSGAGLFGSGGYDGGFSAFGMALGVGCATVALFGLYFEDGWDGSYANAETMSPEDLALEGTVDTDYSADDGGGGGGCGGGGCGG